MIICRFCNADITPVQIIGIDKLNLIVDSITRHMRSAHQDIINKQNPKLIEVLEKTATIAAILFTLRFAQGHEVESSKKTLQEMLISAMPAVSD